MKNLTIIALIALLSGLGSGKDYCPSPLVVCRAWGHLDSTIDPFCCKDGSTYCDEYKVEKWACSTTPETYGYRNFALARHYDASYNCAGDQGPGCY